MSPLMAPIKGQLKEKYDTPTCMEVEHYILRLKCSIIENKKIRRSTTIYESKSWRETGTPGNEKSKIEKDRKQGIKRHVRSPLI